MSLQVGIGSLGGTVFFQVGLCTPLRTMNCRIHVLDEALLLLRNYCRDNSLKVTNVSSKTTKGLTFHKTSRFPKKTVNLLLKNQ